VARISDGREPVEPTNKQQLERWNRILDAAENLGSQQGLDQVQVSEVARDAGVALGTVYRYFPSKAWLFTTLLQTRVKSMMTVRTLRQTGDPITSIADALIELNRELLARPLLATAMVQSTLNGLANVSPDQVDRVEQSMMAAIFSVLSDGHPDEQTTSRVRLLGYSWWGVLVSVMSARISAEEGEIELRNATHLLLGSLADARLRAVEPKRPRRADPRAV